MITAFGAFPGVPRNATADMVCALADENGIALRSPSFRAADFAVGRGLVRLPSGRRVLASLLVLPVVWDAAGALVAKEVRAARAALVVMSGVAAPAQPIFVEAIASAARAPARDAFGLRPSRRVRFSRALRATLDVELARAAMARALVSEPELAPRIRGVACREAGPDNAYVCNATAHVTALAARRALRVLRSPGAPDGLRVERIGARHGFVHWPGDLDPAHAHACARVLLAAIDALT